MTTYINNAAANQAQANQEAAKKTNKLFDRNDFKGSIARIARAGSGLFSILTADIHDVSEMDNDQVRAATEKTFQTAKAKLMEEVKVMNSIPGYKNSKAVKDFEEAVNTFIGFEKEILEIKDINVLRKVLLMFWTGVKYIAGLVMRSCATAAKFVGTYGLRVIAVGLDFVIKIVKKAAGFLKTAWMVVKAIRVSKSGKEEEVNPDDFNEGAGI